MVILREEGTNSETMMSLCNITLTKAVTLSLFHARCTIQKALAMISKASCLQLVNCLDQEDPLNAPGDSNTGDSSDLELISVYAQLRGIKEDVVFCVSHNVEL